MCATAPPTPNCKDHSTTSTALNTTLTATTTASKTNTTATTTSTTSERKAKGDDTTTTENSMSNRIVYIPLASIYAIFFGFLF